MSISDDELIEEIDILIKLIEEKEHLEKRNDILELCSKSSIFYSETIESLKLSKKHKASISEIKINKLLNNVERNCPFNFIYFPELSFEMIKKFNTIKDIFMKEN